MAKFNLSSLPSEKKAVNLSLLPSEKKAVDLLVEKKKGMSTESISTELRQQALDIGKLQLSGLNKLGKRVIEAPEDIVSFLTKKKPDRMVSEFLMGTQEEQELTKQALTPKSEFFKKQKILSSTLEDLPGLAATAPLGPTRGLARGAPFIKSIISKRGPEVFARAGVFGGAFEAATSEESPTLKDIATTAGVFSAFPAAGKAFEPASDFVKTFAAKRLGPLFKFTEKQLKRVMTEGKGNTSFEKNLSVLSNFLEQKVEGVTAYKTMKNISPKLNDLDNKLTEVLVSDKKSKVSIDSILNELKETINDMDIETLRFISGTLKEGIPSAKAIYNNTAKQFKDAIKKSFGDKSSLNMIELQQVKRALRDASFASEAASRQANKDLYSIINNKIKDNFKGTHGNIVDSLNKDMQTLILAESSLDKQLSAQLNTAVNIFEIAAIMGSASAVFLPYGGTWGNIGGSLVGGFVLLKNPTVRLNLAKSVNKFGDYLGGVGKISTSPSVKEKLIEDYLFKNPKFKPLVDQIRINNKGVLNIKELEEALKASGRKLENGEIVKDIEKIIKQIK